MEGQIIAKHFQLKEKIGIGAFSEIWKATHLKTNQEVAVKFDELGSMRQTLYSECKIYLWFHAEAENVDFKIPEVYYYGIEGDRDVMIMDLLGPSLEELLEKCGGKFSLKTVLMCIEQMLQSVEYIHKRRIIHRDIKPADFTIGVGETANRVFIIDFGSGKSYTNKQGEHVYYSDGKPVKCTPRFGSINTHLGVEQTRRDDMESAGYVFIYLLKGELPWQNMKARSAEEKYNKIKEKKIFLKVSELCKKIPVEFAQYMDYCRKMKFSDEPDYEYLRGLFRDLFKKEKFEFDYKYDWVEKS